jgi:arginase family enzyme
VVPGGLAPTTLRAVLAGLPRERVVGLEVAEFEAREDAEGAGPGTRGGLATLLEALSPVLP